MPAVASSLPQSAHSAAQNALTAALNDPESQPPPPPVVKGENGGLKLDTDVDDEGVDLEGEIEEGQELEAPRAGKNAGGDDGDEVSGALGGLSLNELPRTVFEDPMTFNVKVIYSSKSAKSLLKGLDNSLCHVSWLGNGSTHCTRRGRSGSTRRKRRASPRRPSQARPRT